MTYIAVIEIPKGDDRRRHLSFKKDGFVDLGSIKDVIPVNGGVMPVHYGYIENTKNAAEGDEVDVLILSKEKFSVGEKVNVFPIALIKRDDGDDKIVAVDDEQSVITVWDDIVEKERALILGFFGYKNKITAIEDAAAARAYLEGARVIDPSQK